MKRDTILIIAMAASGLLSQLTKGTKLCYVFAGIFVLLIIVFVVGSLLMINKWTKHEN